MEGTFIPGSIVVGIDGSPLSTAALAWGTRQAIDRHLPLHLVHAFATDLPILGFGVLNDDNAVRAEGERLLADAVARVHAFNRSVHVSSVCTSGFASRSLVNASHQATMVVVGATGYGVFSLASIGAVALQVVTHAACPVAVIGHEGTNPVPYGRVVVGVDGSECSLLALQHAFELAEMRDSELDVVHAWQARRRDDPTLATGSNWPAYEKSLEDLVSGAIAERAKLHKEVKINQEVVRADPARVLLDRAKEADILVVGNRGVGGFPGLRLGTVAGSVLGRCTSPLMISRLPER